MSHKKKANSFVRIWFPFIILCAVALAAFLILKNTGTKYKTNESAKLPLLNYRININQDTVLGDLVQFGISVLFSNTGDTTATNIESRLYFIYSDPPIEQYRQILLAEVSPREQNMMRFREYIPASYVSDFYAVLKVKYSIPGRNGEPLHSDYRFFRYEPSDQKLVDIKDSEDRLKKVVDRYW